MDKYGDKDFPTFDPPARYNDASRRMTLLIEIGCPDAIILRVKLRLGYPPNLPIINRR